ncbi:MAG TPA: glycosyltransferase family 2 protein [Opitutales bacterium]|nr:glycosyltransferase family 2 protein [Opitutales bacterium]
MKISVITVTYNSASTIVDTVESVLGQTHPEIEYLIVDGASTDQTLEKLEPCRDRLAGVLSEPDRGMYDAMNKGIARATGEVVAILNSDDVYANPEVLSKVAVAFAGEPGEPSDGGRTFLSANEARHPDIVYGDLHYVSADLSKVVRDWKSGSFTPGQFKRGWHPPHPSFFVRRGVYEQLGGYRLDLRIAADYEFMLRVMEKHERKAAYLPEVLVKMRTGGESNRSIVNIWKANKECYRAWRMNEYGPITGAAAILRKPLSKLKQLRR